MDSVKSLPVGCHGFNKICAVLSSGCVMWCPCRNLFDPLLLCPLIQAQTSVEDVEDYWKETTHALEGNHCLRSLHIHCSGSLVLPFQLSEMIESLCRNERLNELTINAGYLRQIGMYRIPDVCVQIP